MLQDQPVKANQMFCLQPKYIYFAEFDCLAGDVLRYKVKITMKVIFPWSITPCDALPGSCCLQHFFILLHDPAFKNICLTTYRGLGPASLIAEGVRNVNSAIRKTKRKAGLTGVQLSQVLLLITGLLLYFSDGYPSYV